MRIKKPPEPVSTQRFLASLCMIVGSLVLVWWVFSRGPHYSATTAPSVVLSSPIPMGDLRAGESGRLDNGENTVFVAIDAAAFDALNTASSAGDTPGITDLIAARRVFVVSRNTTILVIENGVFSVRVRITAGEQLGKSGWVPAEFVKR